METPIAYIPLDRRQAIARGEDLPDRTRGAALFADITFALVGDLHNLVV